MVQIEKEMTAQKAVDQEAKLTQSTEILQACIDEMVETNPKVWAAIEGAPDASDAVYCSAPAAAEWTPPSWYHHEGGKGGFCKVCIAAGATTKSGAFVKVGSNNTDRKKKYGTTCKKHEQTLEHKHSVEALHRGIDMYAKMDRLGADVVLFMEKRFNEVYFLIKENLPLSKLAPLLELGIENGAYKDCGGESPLALSFFGFSYKHIHITTSLSLSPLGVLTGAKMQYDSARIREEILHCISSTVRQEEALNFFDGSPVLGVMFDETSDVSTKSQMNVNHTGINSEGYAEVRFAGIEELPNGSAETIHIALRS
jgi:hypothetical protein